MVNRLEQLAEVVSIREIAKLIGERCSQIGELSHPTVVRWMKIKKCEKFPRRMREALRYLHEPSTNVSIAEWPSLDQLPSILTYTIFDKDNQEKNILKKVYNTSSNVLRYPSKNEALEAVRNGTVDITLTDWCEESDDLNFLAQVRRHPYLSVVSSKDILNPNGVVQYLKALSYVLSNIEKYSSRVNKLSQDKKFLERMDCTAKELTEFYNECVENAKTERFYYGLDSEYRERRRMKLSTDDFLKFLELLDSTKTISPEGFT
jgi:hypothetical protein